MFKRCFESPSTEIFYKNLCSVKILNKFKIFMPKKLIILSLVFLLVIPSIVFAQGKIIHEPLQPLGTIDINNLWLIIIRIIDIFWKIFVGIAILMFIFSGYMFLTAKGDPGRIKLAKEAFVWGVVGVGVALLSTSIIWTISWSILVGA